MAKSNFKKRIEYEQLTKDVVEKYLNDIRIDGTVKWNVTLDGKKWCYTSNRCFGVSKRR